MEVVTLGFLVTLVLIVIGVPIAMAFCVLTIILLSWSGQDAGYLIEVTYKRLDTILLMSVPLFILFGTILDSTGLARRLVDFINLLIGKFRSGLGAVTVFATAVFGSISGTDLASISCIGTVMIPLLTEKGYTRGHSTALVACSGILGQLVPPSVPMIFYAIITGNSILGVWFSTLGPAVAIVTMYCILNAIMTRKMPIVMEEKSESYRILFTKIVENGKRSVPVLLLPIFIFGSLYSGLITPTEVALLGVVYVVLMGYYYRALTWEGIQTGLVTTAALTGAVTIMFYFTETASKILILEGITTQFANWIVTNSPNQAVTLMLLNFILLLMGRLKVMQCASLPSKVKSSGKAAVY